MANISKAQGALKAAQNALQKQEAEYAEALAKAQKMKASEMSKAILDAVDLVTEHKLERLEFDKTLVCTIEDDTNKKKGEYIVTDGSTSFTAYSDVTIYMKGLRVYVTVPNGNFDNKKLITGRYIDSENAEYYTYKPPFEDYLDMSGNLIKNNIEKGLVANHPTNKEVVVWQIDNFTQGKGYTLLGIRADFRSWLSSYKTKSGEYGLRLDIQSRETSTSQGEDKLKHYSCELTNNDMYGNPYNFETFYSQEKTFDISKIAEIVSMKLVFFQKPGTFKNKEGEIPHSFNGADLPANLFVKNPYVSLGYAEQDFADDTVLLMSLDSKTYDATSTKTQNTKTINARWIHFIKNEDGTDADVVSIDYEDEIPANAEIHWYRYYLSEGLDDELAGVFWDEIESNKNKLSYTFYPDINAEFERIKVIVENPSRKYIKLQKQLELNKINMDDSLDEGEKLIQKQAIEEDYSYESKVNYYESDVIVFENEKPVANPATVDLVNGLQISVDPADKGGLDGKYCIYGIDYKLLNSAEKGRMRPLEATYSSLVTGEPSLDKAAKITWKIPLQHTMIYPPTKGKEYLFETKNMDGSVTSDKATIEFLFSNNVRVAATEVQLAKPEFYPESATHILITRDGTEDYTKTGEDTEAQQIEVKQYFRIKDVYQPGNSNNTIECIVLKNNIEYPASADLTFGPQGTNGTDYTLTLEFENNQNCLYAKSSSGINVTAHLMDYENKPIEDVTCSFSWYSGDKDKMESLGSGSMKTLIRVKEAYRNNTDLDYYILQGVINYGKATKTNENGDEIEVPGVNLTAYLPIPIKYDNSFTLIEAPTTIIYDNNGVNPTYYKGGLKIYKEDQSKPFTGQNCFWQVITTDESGQENGYYPFIRDNENGISELVPTNSYYNKIKNGKTVPLTEIALQYCQFTEDSKVSVFWTQPILIRQNRWPSAMLNKWDGTLQIDENQGTILSQMVGAGYKDDENRFNGVLMGNVSIALASEAATAVAKDEDLIKGNTRPEGTTGVYGFHQGAPSFGLMDNGTAFFGKAGGGQILIDGNSSTIQSYKYRNGTEGGKTEGFKPKQQGMCIDLDNGWIDIQGSGKENKSVVHLGTEGTDADPYARIVSKAGNPMLEISSKEYYLQTDGYTVEKSTTDSETGAVTVETPGKGIKLDLEKSSLTGYDFHLKTIESSGTFKGSYVELDSGGKPYFKVHYERAQTNNEEWSASVNKKRSHNLIYIGTDDFYLQSRKFDTTDETGTKINLDSGRITSYNFNLEAGTGANKIIMNSSSTNNDYPLKIGPKFKVKWDGSLEASGINVSGTVNATDGKIGSWSINSGAIENGNVKLTSDGNLVASNVDLSGKIEASSGKIGSWSITNGSLSAGSTTLYSSGNIYCTNLTTAGTVIIGGDSIKLGGQLIDITEVPVMVGVNHWAGGDEVTFWALGSSNLFEASNLFKVTIRETFVQARLKNIPMLTAGGKTYDGTTGPENKANVVSKG